MMKLQKPPFDLPFNPAEMEKMRNFQIKLREPWLDQFHEGALTNGTVTIPYRLYIPNNSSEQTPLVVILHGIGGCGEDNKGQLLDNDAIIDWVKAQDNGLLEPCYILAPQCPSEIPNHMWEIPYLEVVNHIVDTISNGYSIDKDRLYITGLSLGGYGVWNLNRMYPDKYAAVISCCPACVKGTQFENHIYMEGIIECAPALIGKPLWMFHSEDDFAIPVEVTNKMADILNAAGASFCLTIYPEEKGYNHSCWDPAYKTPELFKWLTSQKRK